MYTEKDKEIEEDSSGQQNKEEIQNKIKVEFLQINILVGFKSKIQQLLQVLDCSIH